MRVRFVILATLASLLASTDAKSTDSVVKKKITITNPDASEAVEGVYLQQGKNKYVVFPLSDDEDVPKEELPEDNSDLHGKEERAVGVSAGTTTKLKKQFSGEYNTWWNKVLWHLFRKITPEDYRPH
ncbi:hypothetical protein GN244_ATG14334 [Phytophthora infestans]|uniref:RxLR effector protein n=1 Tax=Phytophthora infestans TaxID=4787 RepID=A0A833SV66_PHYIN|nr:hypothetical protein GN244_ATG14334 [Phytophthora infestans]